MPKKLTTPFYFRKVFLILIFILILISMVSFIFFRQKVTDNLYQIALDPFYQPPSMTDHLLPGQLIRNQIISTPIPGGTAYRILYVSQLSSSGKTFSSGIIFIPHTPAPSEGRKIVAWAHGTIGMGVNCAPSRNPDFIDNLPWITQMMQQNFVVVATDYSGLGTPGTQRYLLGRDQAMDILNSIKAAANFPGSNTSKDYVLWGHSQGGQAVLFASYLAPKILPQYHLYGVAAAAPAAELTALVKEQLYGPVPWIIASEIAMAWPLQYANLDLEHSLTPLAYHSYQQMAEQCITNSAIEAITLSKIGQQFFSTDPTTIPAWKQAFIDQTPPPISFIPLLIIQSLTDQVVLPDTTALLITKSCNTGTNLQTIWLNDVPHQNTAMVAGPDVVNWFVDRFNSKPFNSSCDETLPIAPSVITPNT